MRKTETMTKGMGRRLFVALCLCASLLAAGSLAQFESPPAALNATTDVLENATSVEMAPDSTSPGGRLAGAVGTVSSGLGNATMDADANATMDANATTETAPDSTSDGSSGGGRLAGAVGTAKDTAAAAKDTATAAAPAAAATATAVSGTASATASPGTAPTYSMDGFGCYNKTNIQCDCSASRSQDSCQAEGLIWAKDCACVEGGPASRQLYTNFEPSAVPGGIDSQTGQVVPANAAVFSASSGSRRSRRRRLA